MATRVVTRSTTLPVDPGELRSWLRYDDAAQLPDDQARSLILSAVGVIEGHLARFFFATTVEEPWHLPCLDEPQGLRLKYADVAAVNSLVAVDEDSVSATVDGDDYQLINEDGAAFIAPPYSSGSWPAAVLDAVTLTVTYQSRMYAIAADMDEGLRQAVRVLCAWMERHREEANLPGHVRSLLEPYERGDY